MASPLTSIIPRSSWATLPGQRAEQLATVIGAPMASAATCAAGYDYFSNVLHIGAARVAGAPRARTSSLLSTNTLSHRKRTASKVLARTGEAQTVLSTALGLALNSLGMLLVRVNADQRWHRGATVEAGDGVAFFTEGQALLIHGHARYVPWLGPAPPDAVVGLR